MKKIILSILYVTASLIILLGLLLVSPYYYYNQIINQEYSSEWFSLNQFEKSYLLPSKKIEIKDPDLGNDDLWNKFHFKDVYIPVPVRNPFFYVSPILDYQEEKKTTNFGISVYGTNDFEISKVYFVDNRFLPNIIRSQELFKLPLVTQFIKSIPSSKVWEDIFSRDLTNWNIGYLDLAYNLYILQLRSKILPSKFKSFSSLDKNTGLIELVSKDKDFKTELVLKKQRGLIYSYIIHTDLNNNESQVLRYKYLKEISFRPGSESLARLLYKEFKALKYKDQIGQLGLLYLLSAFSHNPSKELLIEMIQYLERGERNERQLESLYTYAAKRFGKTFTNKIIEGVKLEDELELRRDIELENKRRREELAREENSPIPVEKTDDEKLEERIKKAKESKGIKTNRMILD